MGECIFNYIKTSVLYENIKSKALAIEFGYRLWNIDKKDLGNRLVHAYCQMVFQDGFYHADPHPGNILVQQNGTVVLLDFGAVATLDPKMQKGIPQLIEAAVKNDSETIIQILSDLGFIAEGK